VAAGKPGPEPRSDETRPRKRISARTAGRSSPAERTAERADARSLLVAVRALVRRFSISERADVACCGVTVAQAATLEALRAEGPSRLGSLGRRLGIAPSTLTRNVDRLERSGLVTCVPDPQDQRALRLGLTPSGRTAAAVLERQEEAFAQQVLNRLPAERRPTVVAALAELLGAVRGATEACCPGAFDHLMRGIPQAEACERRGDDEDEGCCGSGR
jgi:DNA-binding MarR family transcriptional regulator